MKINCIIVDDEPLARSVIKKYLVKLPSLRLIKECSNAVEAASVLHENKIELIFLDIKMPELSGLEFLKTLPNPPLVIITTAFSEYAVEGYEYSVIDYLLKPIDKERFHQAIERIKSRLKDKEKNMNQLVELLNSRDTNEFSSHLFVQKSDKFLNIPVTDILHLEASGDYTILSTADDQFLSSSGIGKLETRLDPNIFIRVHRSTIINLNHLKEIEKHFNGGLVVKMKNGKSFSVSRTYAKEIRKKVV